MNKLQTMDKPAVQDKGDCWICFNKGKNIILTTEDSERTLKSCETYLDISIIIKDFGKENQVSCCSCCYESTRQLMSLEEQVEKLQQEISDVSSVFSKNVLELRSRINKASNSVLPTEKGFKSPNYFKRHSFEMIENVPVKEEVIETVSKELPADSQGITKPNDYIFSDPGFEIYEIDNVNYVESGTAVDSEDAIEVKYSYDEIDSREVDNPANESVTHQGLSETTGEENEQAKKTSTADLAKCLKMPNIQLKRVQLGNYRNPPKIVVDAVKENSKCEKALDDSSEPNNSYKTISKELRFKCHEISCSKSFKKNCDFVKHLHIQSSEKKRKQYKCSQCSKSFRVSTNLKDHERTHSGEKPYKCSTCSKSFRSQSNLRTHQETHSEERPHQCSRCQKSFKTAAQLKRHERIHSGERPYKCSFCEKSFKVLSAFRIHEAIHSEKKPYKCSLCEKSFRRRCNLKEHIRLHTGEKPFNCSYCSKSFIQSNNLKRHERSHTGDKPHKCYFCSKPFTCSTDAKKHEMIHTGERPYKCSSCEKSFVQRCNLKIHYDRIHGDEERKH